LRNDENGAKICRNAFDMIKIPVVRFTQAKVTFYVGNIKASELCAIGVIDSWDSDKGWNIDKQGYQRESYPQHYKAIAVFLRNNPTALLPSSILLSARRGELGELKFDVTNEAADHAFGYLEIPKGRNLYLVDGQHRMLGLRHAINEFKEKRLEDFLLPVVVLYDADKIEELSQFHLINDRQKRIATNLAQALLGTVLEEYPGVSKMLLGSKGMWSMKATMIAVSLHEGKEPGNVWSGRMTLPNEPKGPLAAASLSSFVNSLKPFFSATYPHKMNNDELRDYLIRFWSALKLTLPKSFSSPKDYVIQRTTGVYSLHWMASELAKQKPKVLTASPAAIKPLLETDHVHMTESMWVKKGTLAKEYRGNARFRDLADEILSQMGLAQSRPKAP
jgi:DGQHR domain-containing protein